MDSGESKPKPKAPYTRKATDIRTESLIEEVKKRPILWDPALVGYRRKNLRTAAWLDVCRAVVSDYSEKTATEKENLERRIFVKWRTVRDGYIKWNRKAPPPSKKWPTNNSRKYIYADLLTFLDRVIPLKATADADPECFVEEIFEEDTSTQAQVHNHAETSYDAGRTLAEDGASFLVSSNLRPNPQDGEGDSAFFQSLLPLMQGLNRQSRLQFRMKVMETLHQLLESPDL